MNPTHERSFWDYEDRQNHSSKGPKNPNNFTRKKGSHGGNFKFRMNRLLNRR